MTRFRLQSFANVLAGLVIVIQAKLQACRYASHFSSSILICGGVLLLVSGIAGFFAPESRATYSTTPPNER